METCVLIPQEFSLVLTAGPSPAVAATSPAVDRNANKLPEMRVNVWTNARIPQGTLIYPFQGTIRLDKLEVYSYLDDNDVSRPVVLSLFIFVAISHFLHGGTENVAGGGYAATQPLNFKGNQSAMKQPECYSEY
jgi:hypothetical protein